MKTEKSKLLTTGIAAAPAKLVDNSAYSASLRGDSQDVVTRVVPPAFLDGPEAQHPAPPEPDPLTDAELIQAEAAKISIDELPPEVVTALRDGVEYVDATQLIQITLTHLVGLHRLCHQMAKSMVTMQGALIRNGEKLIELEADISQFGIPSSKDKRQKIVGVESKPLVGFDKNR